MPRDELGRLLARFEGPASHIITEAEFSDRYA
jgi:hypothetical protein